MHNLTILEKIWNTQKQNFDLLIYVPHNSIDKDFIKKVRETSKISLDSVSDDLLYKYMYHEADTWVIEVLESMKKYLEKSEFSIWILKVEIPRGFCDLNRPLELAIPEVFRDKSWDEIYLKAEKEIENVIQKSDFIFHFHSMNGFNPIEKSIFNENANSDFFKNHIEKVYSGSKRECTILTENIDWEYLTEKKFDKIFKEKFAENNLVLEENTAYRLLDHFPCTNIIRKHKSGFFEITKTAIATEKTKNNFDTNKIIFDEKKVEIYWKVLSEILLKYLKTKNN